MCMLLQFHLQKAHCGNWIHLLWLCWWINLFENVGKNNIFSSKSFRYRNIYLFILSSNIFKELHISFSLFLLSFIFFFTKFDKKLLAFKFKAIFKQKNIFKCWHHQNYLKTWHIFLLFWIITFILYMLPKMI